MLVNFGFFGAAGWRNVGNKLEEAFGAFKDWCRVHGKTTSLTELSLKVFKIQSFLTDIDRTGFYFGQVIGPGVRV